MDGRVTAFVVRSGDSLHQVLLDEHHRRELPHARIVRRRDERKAALQRTCSFHNISEDGASIGN